MLSDSDEPAVPETDAEVPGVEEVSGSDRAAFSTAVILQHVADSLSPDARAVIQGEGRKALQRCDSEQHSCATASTSAARKH